MTTTKPITADELLHMPRGEGRRYELIQGRLIETMAAGAEHGRVAQRFGNALGAYADDRDFGEVLAAETGFRLSRDPDTVLAPDAAWIAPGRLVGRVAGFAEFPPDLVVEIRSPGQDLTDKVRMWPEFGAQEVWYADPETTTVTRHRAGREPETLNEDDTLDGGDLLPGFSVPVWQLFRRHR